MVIFLRKDVNIFYDSIFDKKGIVWIDTKAKSYWKLDPHVLIFWIRLWPLWRSSSSGDRTWTCCSCRGCRWGISLRTSYCPGTRGGNVKSRSGSAWYVFFTIFNDLFTRALFSRDEPARTKLHNASHGARKHQIMERRIQNENRRYRIQRIFAGTNSWHIDT